jgi:hypothetical protein
MMVVLSVVAFRRLANGSHVKLPCNEVTGTLGAVNYRSITMQDTDNTAVLAFSCLQACQWISCGTAL